MLFLEQVREIQTDYTRFGVSIWKYRSKNLYSSFYFGDHISLILLFLLPLYFFYILSSSAFMEDWGRIWALLYVSSGSQSSVCKIQWRFLERHMYHGLSKLKYMHRPLLGAKLKYCLKSAKFSLQRMDDFSFSRIVFSFPKNIVAGLTLNSRKSGTVLCNTVEGTIPGFSKHFFIELECLPWTANSQACYWSLQYKLSFPGCLEDIIKKNQKINK